MSEHESTSAIGELTWHKSSYSGSSGGQCVEVAASSGTVHVRDSKNKAGAVLSFTADEWKAFVRFAAQR